MNIHARLDPARTPAVVIMHHSAFPALVLELHKREGSWVMAATAEGLDAAQLERVREMGVHSAKVLAVRHGYLTVDAACEALVHSEGRRTLSALIPDDGAHAG